jgi:hypothetical protein
VDPMNRTKQSRPKALPKRLRISIGGYFGPCYSVTLEEGRLIYTYSARGPSGGEPKPEWPLEPKLRELLGLSPLPGPDEIQPSAKQWQAFRTALNPAQRLELASQVLGSCRLRRDRVGPLISLTQTDHSSRAAITAFRGGTGKSASHYRGWDGQHLREILSGGRPASGTTLPVVYLWRLDALGLWRTSATRLEVVRAKSFC